MKHLRKHIARLALAVMLAFSATVPAKGQVPTGLPTFDLAQFLNILEQIRVDGIDAAENLLELGNILGVSKDNLQAFNDVYGFLKDNAQHIRDAREIMNIVDECSSRTQYVLETYTRLYESGKIDFATLNRALRATNSTLRFYSKTMSRIKDGINQKMSWKDAMDFMNQQLEELLTSNLEVEDELDRLIAEIRVEEITDAYNDKMDELLGRGERAGAAELSNVKGQLAEPPGETLEGAKYKLHGSLGTAFRIAEYLEAFILALFAVLAFYAYEKGGGNQHKDAYIKVIVGTLFIAVLTELFKYLLS